jgi:hypothetical protein
MVVNTIFDGNEASFAFVARSCGNHAQMTPYISNDRLVIHPGYAEFMLPGDCRGVDTKTPLSSVRATTA